MIKDLTNRRVTRRGTARKGIVTGPYKGAPNAWNVTFDDGKTNSYYARDLVLIGVNCLNCKAEIPDKEGIYTPEDILFCQESCWQDLRPSPMECEHPKDSQMLEVIQIDGKLVNYPICANCGQKV